MQTQGPRWVWSELLGCLALALSSDITLPPACPSTSPRP